MEEEKEKTISPTTYIISIFLVLKREKGRDLKGQGKKKGGNRLRAVVALYSVFGRRAQKS